MQLCRHSPTDPIVALLVIHPAVGGARSARTATKERIGDIRAHHARAPGLDVHFDRRWRDKTGRSFLAVGTR
jgi:hypothetical protein